MSIEAANDIAFEGDIAVILWPHTYIIAIIARTEILQIVVVYFRNVNRLRSTSICWFVNIPNQHTDNKEQ
jgi:hypothetical protein